MNLRKHFLEAVTLIAAALLCALVANALASRERKIAVVGTYPNALNVPAPAPETTTTTTTPAPSPITETTATITTTTIAPAPVTTTTKPTTTTTPPIKPASQPTPAQQPSNAATQQPPKQDLSKYTPHPDKAYIEIPYAGVAALYGGGALFLDARRTSVYEQGHVAGARPFSVWESDVDDKVRRLWEQRQDPKEQALPIVVYCSGGDCEDSHMLAQKLWGAQFNNVYVYKDGFPDWQAHRGAVHTGALP